MKKAWVFSYPLSAQPRLWSDGANTQADQSLRWAHSHFVGFVMSRLKYPKDFFRKTHHCYDNETNIVISLSLRVFHRRFKFETINSSWLLYDKSLLKNKMFKALSTTFRKRVDAVSSWHNSALSSHWQHSGKELARQVSTDTSEKNLFCWIRNINPLYKKWL